MRIALLAALLLILGPFSASGVVFLQTPEPTEFSIIVFMSDDLSDGPTGGTSGTYGLARNAPANIPQGFPAGLPNIDSLRSNGIRFTNVYRPVGCASTRYSLLSGLEGWQSGVLNGSAPNGYPAATGTHFPEYVPTNYHVALYGKLGAAGAAPDPNDVALDIGFDYFLGKMSPNAGDWFDYSISEGIAPAPIVPYTQNVPGDYLGDTMHQFAADWIRANPAVTGRPYLLFSWTNHAHQGSPHVPPPVGTVSSCALPTDQDCAIQEAQWHDKNIGQIIAAAKEIDPNLSKTVVIYASGDNGDGWEFDVNCLGGNSKGILCQAGLNADDLVIAYGDVIPGLRGGVDANTPIQITDIFETVLGYTGTSGAVPDTNRFGTDDRNLWAPGDCTSGPLCYDGSDRCVFVSNNETGGTRTVGAADRRSASCMTPATDGYRYLVNIDGAEEFIYELPDETNECTGAACDAAKAELRTLIFAHDGLPLPSAGFDCDVQPGDSIFCEDFEGVGFRNTPSFTNGDIDPDYTTPPAPLSGLESAFIPTTPNTSYTGWATVCTGLDCATSAHYVRTGASTGFGTVLEHYALNETTRHCFLGITGTNTIRVGSLGGPIVNGTIVPTQGVEYDAYLDYDRSTGACIATVRARSEQLDRSGTVVDTVTSTGNTGLDTGFTYLTTTSQTPIVIDDLNTRAGTIP